MVLWASGTFVAYCAHKVDDELRSCLARIEIIDQQMDAIETNLNLFEAPWKIEFAMLEAALRFQCSNDVFSSSSSTSLQIQS